MIGYLRDFLRSERGNVESALVIIPLMFLFLGSLQIMAIISTRNLERTLAHDFAKSDSFAESMTSSSENYFNTPSRFNFGLTPSQSSEAINQVKSTWHFDNLKLISVRIRKQIPHIFPWLSKITSTNEIKVAGASVVEEIP